MPTTKNAKAAENRPSKISDLTYVIPFGRYVGSSQVGPGADEVLVGREGHRAYFIELLISAGRQGAFLVTGRRGAGKTSFVRHCIAEYEASVFKRFLRHSIGRALWDRALVVLFWAVLLVSAVLLSELAELLTAIESPEPHRVLLWLALVPIGVALLFPCVYAREVVEVVSDAILQKKKSKIKRTRHSSVLATGIVLSVIALLWFLPGLSSPAWAASALFSLLAAIYLGAQTLSLRVDFKQSDRCSGLAKASVLLLIEILLAVGLAVTTIWTAVGSWSWIPVQSSAPENELIGRVAINFQNGLLMIAGGLFLRAWYQRGAALKSLLSDYRRNPAKIEEDPVFQAQQRGGLNYRTPAVVLAVASGALALRFGTWDEWWVAAALTTVMVGFGTIMFRRPMQGGPPPKIRRPSALSALLALIASASISLVFALQLAHPVLRLVFDRTLEPIMIPVRLHGPPDFPSALAGITGLQPAFQSRDRALPEDNGEALEHRAQAARPSAVFWRRDETLIWLGVALSLMILLHFIHYEWVVRPHVAIREDGPLDLAGRAPWDDEEFLDSEDPDRWRIHRKMAELTLPWAVYRIWLPSLAVSVNLGFDAKLGSGQVIQAMLVGLRDVYHRTFISWSRGPANIGRITAFLGILGLVTLAGNAWFELPTTEQIRLWSLQLKNQEEANKLAGEPRRNFGSPGRSTCSILAETRTVRTTRLADLACRLGPGWFDALYLDLMPKQLSLASTLSSRAPGEPTKSSNERLLLYALLPYRQPVESTAVVYEFEGAERRWNRLQSSGLHFNIYHVLLFFVFLISGRWAARKLPILPYSLNLRRIDDLLDSMSARTRVTQRPTLWEPARWIYSLVADRVRETEREPLDPRTVELAFLQILEEIQRGGLRMPGIARPHLNLPAPEITFVFDELDKLGTRLDPEDEDPLSLAAELRAHQADQERTLRLRGLLSDLKNVLSSAPARFIFIGGRNLHDEWLADQTARQPLLTNIFTAEVYLPSLLTDRAGERCPENPKKGGTRRTGLHTRIEEYLSLQHTRATQLYGEWALKGWRPSFGLAIASLSEERFAAARPSEPTAHLSEPTAHLSEPTAHLSEPTAHLSEPTAHLEVYCCPQKPEDPWEDLKGGEGSSMIRDFVDFLTLRSMGNPKRMKELLASFIRPMGQVVKVLQRWQLPCRHVLRFRDVEVFRIQLIASIYRHLAGAFEMRMVSRDDKMATSIFFLSDFLFKFHRRAFSWANLERVDELAHIHRAPDLRDLQEEMVDLYSERFLHRVLNGMYSFRFRSDVAREVEYLSRRSAAEMAALNFTLDESQSLKAIYHGALEQREKREGPNSGLVAGLGELYEFDQEYETARHHYRRAIDILDKKLQKKTGSQESVRRLLLGEDEGMDDARAFLPWGESRLRLMLQIGMTFEIARSLEHAVTEYRAARTLARALVKACLGLDQRRIPRDALPPGRFHTLENLSILFQPLFAEAWASEKITSTVDTSNQLVEAGLWEVRKNLPFVNKPKVVPSEDSTIPAHANLALTVSQLHNKAGDLYFFKGCQPVLWTQMVGRKFWKTEEKKDRLTDGYLLRAHYHYAVSLHEIRRYSYHRIESSQHRLSLAATPARTLLGEALPDFLWRAVASSVNDMAEATLGRVSLFGLLRSLHEGAKVSGREVKNLEEELLAWLQLDDKSASRSRKLKLDLGDGRMVSLGDRSNWLGKWRRRATFTSSKTPLLAFEGPDSPNTRFLVSIHLCRTGARFFEKGGYLEDAARELLQVCWIVSRMLWWLRTAEVCRAWEAASRDEARARGGETTPAGEIESLETAVFDGKRPRELLGDHRARAFLDHLTGFVVDRLEEADALFRQSRYRLTEREGRKLGDLVPPDILTLACNLGLWLRSRSRGQGDSRNAILDRRLRNLIKSWLGGVPDEGFAETLQNSLRWQRYPLLNRLNALQILVDDAVLNSPKEGDGAAARIHLEEILDLKEQYGAPLHFTPMQSGSTCALYWLRWRPDGTEATPDQRPFLNRVFQTAQRDLQASEEMFTLRRAFYESISDLYYLYDDFNDRQIHFKHALQMAGAEMTTLLRQLLKVAEKTEG